MREVKEFYVIQYGVRNLKYLGGDFYKFKKVDSINDAEKFESKEMAKRHLNIFEKGRILKVEATYEIVED